MTIHTVLNLSSKRHRISSSNSSVEIGSKSLPEMRRLLSVITITVSSEFSIRWLISSPIGRSFIRWVRMEWTLPCERTHLNRNFIFLQLRRMLVVGGSFKFMKKQRVKHCNCYYVCFHPQHSRCPPRTKRMSDNKERVITVSKTNLTGPIYRVHLPNLNLIPDQYWILSRPNFSC